MTSRVAAEFRRCLLDMDVAGVRRVWAQVRPDLPPLTSDAEALIAIHMARTQAASLPERCRQYSHRWLIDRNFPSMLPDQLKPSHEQAGAPRVVESVGISVNSRYGAQVIEPIAYAMRTAVLDAYADNRRDPQFVRQRMQAARMKERKALGLRRIHG